jgi:hypothetical protein
MPPLITLTTDFGTRDPYVAAMKGILAARCPAATVMDLTHEIAPQDVREAAFFLLGACPFFPPGTIHVVVVDPGVGTSRRAVVAQIDHQYFVCPDNGVLTLMGSGATPRVHEIITPAFQRETVSATFHGRDLFAPAAAALACGHALQDAGPPVDSLVQLDFPEPRWDGGRLCGEVMHIDRFGNLITNITRAYLEKGEVSEVHVAGRHLSGVHETYGAAPPGGAVALVGSTGFLEISVNQGSAARHFGLGLGAPVQVAF